MTLPLSLAISLDVGFLSLFYTGLGAIVSYVLYYLFDDFGDNWKSKGIWFQVYDIGVETVLIGLIAFWLIFYIKDAPAVFSVSPKLDAFIDSYISGIFFAFSMFIFMDSYSRKIKYIFYEKVRPIMDKYLPEDGSILDFSLKLGPRKTDKEKNTNNYYHH